MMSTISHHGILGMKWGVRRYQNEDGSYTEAGAKRYARQQERSERREMKRAIRETKKDRKQALKNVSQLSDEELEARIKRAQKEQQLQQYSRRISNGKTFVENTMEQIGSKAISAAVVGAVIYAGKKATTDSGVMHEILERFGR